jgi:hypothetical protein
MLTTRRRTFPIPHLLIDLQYIDVLVPLLASLLSQHFQGRFGDLFLFRDQIKHR